MVQIVITKIRIIIFAARYQYKTVIDYDSVFLSNIQVHLDRQYVFNTFKNVYKPIMHSYQVSTSYKV